MNDKDSTKYFIKYGARWKPDPKRDWLLVEQQIIRDNGKWRGKETGIELWEHWKAYISELFPNYIWHRWNLLMLKTYLVSKELALIGPASSTKTNFMAIMALGEWWIAPECTTVLCSSTTIKALERRIFAEINKYFRIGKKKRPWLDGFYMASLPAIVLREADKGGRDLRNGILGLACKSGDGDVGLGEYAGIKNDRVRVFGDEGSYMSMALVKGASNLASNAKPGTLDGYRFVLSGNPMDPGDGLGIVAEPHAEEGGWEGIEQGEKTRTWRNKRAGGITVQLVGTDSPNLDFPEEQEPYPFMIGRKHIRDIETNHGRESKEFNREVKGHMIVGGSRRRVISPDFCRSRGATEPPVWSDALRLQTVVGLDAAYGAVGGDRTVLIELTWGPDVSGKIVMSPQAIPTIVPIRQIRGLSAEDQITAFAKDYCESRGIPASNFGFDGTGRSSLTSSLCRNWSNSVVALEFGGKATERPLGKITSCREKYDRFVSELWFAAREVIEARQMRGLTDPYIEEGSKREWFSKSGKVDAVVTKDVMKELLGRSPDIFDALVTAIEMARRRGFQIEAAAPKPSPNSRNPTEWLNVWKNRSRSLLSSATLTST